MPKKKKTPTKRKKAQRSQKTRKAQKRKKATPAKKTKKPTKRKPTKLAPLAEIIAEMGVTDRTVRFWIKKGCPVRRVKPRGGKGGRPRVFFDRDKLSSWIAANDIDAKGPKDNTPEAPPPGPVGESEEPKPPQEPRDPNFAKAGIVGAVARLRSMERLAYAAFQQSMKFKEDPAKVRAKERIYLEAHQALRRTEQILPKILEHRGEMIPLESVMQEQARIDLAIKNQFLTLPRKLATLLAPVTDPGETEEILQREVDDCLRHIASGKVLQDEEAADVQAPGTPPGS